MNISVLLKIALISILLNQTNAVLSNPNGAEIPIILKINDTESTSQYDFVKSSDNFGFYVPKHNFIFKVVKVAKSGCKRYISQDVELWYPEKEDEYVKKVLIDGVASLHAIRNATIYLLNGDVKHFYQNNGSWTERKSGLVLDIGAQESDYGFEYSRDNANDLDIYIARGKLGFRRIYESTLYPDAQTFIIWKTDSRPEFANKVILANPNGTDKYLVIFKKDGTYSLYNKYHNMIAWKDETNNEASINFLTTMGIEFGTKEQDILEPSPTTQSISSKESASQYLEPPLDTSVRTQSISSPITPVIPTPSQKPRGIPPPDAQYGTGTLSNPIRYEDLICVDILEGSNDCVEYFHDPSTNIHTFTARRPYLIKQVRKGDEKLWEYTNARFADTVYVIVYPNNTMRVSLFCPDFIDDLHRNQLRESISDSNMNDHELNPMSTESPVQEKPSNPDRRRRQKKSKRAKQA